MNFTFFSFSNEATYQKIQNYIYGSCYICIGHCDHRPRKCLYYDSVIPI